VSDGQELVDKDWNLLSQQVDNQPNETPSWRVISAQQLGFQQKEDGCLFSGATHRFGGKIHWRVSRDSWATMGKE
jgi:hypothetical protein